MKKKHSTKPKASAKRGAPAKSPPIPKAKGPKEPAALISRRELADRLNVHMQTVTKWEREGMPIADRGGKGIPSKYKELDVRAWLKVREETSKQSGAMNPVMERARRERAQAILAEQTYDIRMRDLLPREEVEKAWSSEVSAVRTMLLAFPATLADQVFRAATTDGLPAVEKILHDAVRNTLRELADPNRPTPGTAAATGDTAAA